MKKKEPKPNVTTGYILQRLRRLSEIMPQDEHADVDDTSFEGAPIEVYAPPEEGGRLIRAFIRIKQPELRAAIIKLVAQMGYVKTSK